MAYKDVLVYLDPSPDNDNRLDLAISIARSHGARLTGVDASSDAASAVRWRERTAAIKDLFEAETKNAGIAARFYGRGRAGSVVSYGHYADLLIAPQPEFEARELVVAAVPEDVLIKSGVPMLILPYGWQPEPVGQRIVVAWNGSREATRAVHDTMPFLERAKKVTVFEFGAGTTGLRADPKLIVDHLKAHGVTAEAETWSDTGDWTAVEALFVCLETQEADLIIAGAYGRSRLIEGLFGGTSYDLVRQPSLPVLMSH